MTADSSLLADRVVVVTGDSRGLGTAIAKGCAAAGARGVLAARNAAELGALAAEIEAAGGMALAVPTDVSKLDDLRRPPPPRASRPASTTGSRRFPGSG